MCRRVDDARSAQKEAETARETAIKDAEEARSAAKDGAINVGMLKSQLEILRENLGNELTNNYHISEAHCTPLLESSDPNDMRRVVDRVLCAANMKMMMGKNMTASAPVAASRKRKAEPEPVQAVSQPVSVSPVVAAKAAPMDTSPEAILARAMADTFEF